MLFLRRIIPKIRYEECTLIIWNLYKITAFQNIQGAFFVTNFWDNPTQEKHDNDLIHGKNPVDAAVAARIPLIVRSFLGDVEDSLW